MSASLVTIERGRIRRRRLAALALGFVSLTACGRGAATAGATEVEGGVEVAALVATSAPSPRDARVEDLWARAAEGELVDLARLYDGEGESGLIERARVPAYRMTAIAALGSATDFEALPFLADVATTGTEDEARVALESIESVVAVPRRARDPEDALELRQGCDALAELARKVDASIARRSRAISALRMLSATGCIESEAIPKDLDPK